MECHHTTLTGSLAGSLPAATVVSPAAGVLLQAALSSMKQESRSSEGPLPNVS